MAQVTLTYYPDYHSPNTTSDYAQAAVDVFNNNIEPQLDTSVDIYPKIGQTVASWVDDDWDKFKSWLDQNNLVDDDGEIHIYVVDRPFGHNSFAEVQNVTSTSDAYACWNAGKGNIHGEDFNLNLAIQEPFHTMIDGDYCPNLDDHQCGEIRDGPYGDDITPMMTSYDGEVPTSCNGNATTNSHRVRVHDLASCTEVAVETWLNNNF